MPEELLLSQWGALYWIVAVTASLSVHEFSHALIADLLGDSTPRKEGRLTLVPFPHIDPLGFLLFLFFGIGWAKPVRFEPESLRYRSIGKTLVALAGPFSNLVMMSLTVAIAKALNAAGALGPDAMALVTALITVNATLVVVNIIPVPPFDGSKLLLDFLASLHAERLIDDITKYGPFIVLGALFLDGSVGYHIVQRLLTFVITLAKSYIL